MKNTNYKVNAFKINEGTNKGYYIRKNDGRTHVLMNGKQYPIKMKIFHELSKVADRIDG